MDYLVTAAEEGGTRTSLGAKLVECSLPVSDRAPAEEEADPVSLSFVPFQNHLTAASGAVEIYLLDNWAADNKTSRQRIFVT